MGQHVQNPDGSYSQQVSVTGSYVKRDMLTSGATVDVSAAQSAMLDVSLSWGFGHFEGSTDGGSTYKNVYVYNLPTFTQYMRVDYPSRYTVDLSGYTHLKWVEEYRNPTSAASNVVITLSALPMTVIPQKTRKMFEPNIPKLTNVNSVQDFRVLSDLVVSETTVTAYHYSGYRIFKVTDYTNPASTATEITAGSTAWGVDAANRGVRLIRKLDSGRLIAFVNHIETATMNIWLSDVSEANFTNVHSFPHEGDYNVAWNPICVGDVIVVASYWSNRPYTQPMTVRLSKDGGLTWSVIHTAPTSGTGTYHYHDAIYDPYRNRIWVIIGDQMTNANVLYSDDWGATWHTVWTQGQAPTQFTTVTPMRDHVLFGTDQSGVRGVYRYVPQVSKPSTGPLIFEPAAIFTKGVQTGDAAGRASTMPWKCGGVYYGTTFESKLSGDPYYPIIWGSKDGVNFYALHVFNAPLTGAGMTFGNILYDSKNNRLVAYLRTGAQAYTWWADAPTWIEF